MSSDLDFWDFDKYLLSQNGKIIHQIWFGTIPNKRDAKKAYQRLKIYRDSWIIKNPTWRRIEWDKKMISELIKNIYPEHDEMFRNYKYEIQRCDAIRYLILYRYGGWYADMDYYCNRPLDEAMSIYKNDIYFVETPNGIGTENYEHISNSLMYSIPLHNFWKQVMIELEKNQNLPYYYGKHLTVMFSTGPAILNRIYYKYRYKYGVKSLPWRFFHPYGIKDDIRTVNLDREVFTAHISKGSWCGRDTLLFNTIIREWKIMVFILLSLLLPLIIYRFVK